MSARGSPGIYPSFSENNKEISLFDPDTKDSGFSEDGYEERNKLVSSPLCLGLLEDNEATILCFTPQEATPSKRFFLGNKKRLFQTSGDSPSIIAASSLKRLKIFELDSDETANSFDELPLDFSDKILSESPDDEFSYVPSIGVQSTEYTDDDLSSLSSAEVQRDLVKEAVEKSEGDDLIGDFSKAYALPLIVGSNPDLKSISVDTMKDVLEGKFRDILSSVTIIDSRYPYEFKGGHIRGATNIFTKDDCLQLLNKPIKSKDERHILVFHCEFSKERGPNMIRNLRQEDRARNTMNYPTLTYPEVYVLEGGYKKFYQSFPQHCDPMEYKHMLHPEHADEMRLFRKKSKTSDNVLKTSKKSGSTARSSRVVRKSMSNDFF